MFLFQFGNFSVNLNRSFPGCRGNRFPINPCSSFKGFIFVSVNKLIVLITCSPNRPFTFYFSLELHGDLVGHSSMKIITPPSSMFRNQPQHKAFFVPWKKWRTSKITAWGKTCGVFSARRSSAALCLCS